MKKANWPIISDDPYIQEHYEECRNQGTSHNLSEMFASGQTPGAMTDSVFLEGHANGNQFEGQEHIGDFYKREAKIAQVDVKGKVYLSGLAQYPGDPRAWVSGRGDVQRLCEERGWDADGAVKVRAGRREAPETVALAEDIVLKETEKLIEKEPELGRNIEEVKDKVRKKHTPHWAKKK